MLQKKNRMVLNKEFDRAFKSGQSFYGEVLGFKAVNNDLAFSRLGILINTKVSKKAVVRNHFKRQIREIFQAELDNLKVGKDLVIIVSPKILAKNFTEVKTFMEKGFKYLNLYK